MLNHISPSWKDKMKAEFVKDYFNELVHFVIDQYESHQCYPDIHNIFSAFNYCSFDDVKVVIIGQDPYHGNGQANGLSFSVNDDISFPPSLVNIFKELNSDLALEFPKTGNLIKWAMQGVLLLNATLTVRQQEPVSHQNKGWETFTDAVIQKISDEKQDVVFLLWGGFAKKKGKKIDRKKHLVLETGHPSPLSANRGLWFGNKHFSKTNEFLTSRNLKQIDW